MDPNNNQPQPVSPVQPTPQPPKGGPKKSLIIGLIIAVVISLAILVMVLVLAFGRGGPEATVRGYINAANDNNCSEIFGYLSESYLSTGEIDDVDDAIEECEKGVDEDENDVKVEIVSIKDISDDDDDAKDDKNKAVLELIIKEDVEDSDEDEAKLIVTVVKEGGKWLIEDIRFDWSHTLDDENDLDT